MTCLTQKAITETTYESLCLKIGSASLETRQCNYSNMSNSGF